MAIQPLATQIQAPQIQTPNPINQMGQLMALRDSQQQNQMRTMQMGQLQREEADVNTLRGFDPNSPDYLENVTRINPKLGIELQAKQREAQKFELETKVKGQELITASLTAFQEHLKQALTLEDRLAAHQAIYADRDLGPYLASMGATAESGAAQIIEAARSPKTWNEFLIASNEGAEKLREYSFKKADELRKKAGEARAVTGEARAEAKAAQEAIAAKNAQDPDFQRKMTEARTLGEETVKSDVKALQTIPAAVQTATQAVNLIDSLIGKRDYNGDLLKGSAPHPGFETAVGQAIPPGLKFIAGSDTSNFVSRLAQIQGAAFLQAFETLKGGGAISEVEGAKATVAINRMSTSQSEVEFIAAAKDFKDALQGGIATGTARLEAARRRNSGAGAPQQGSNVPARGPGAQRGASGSFATGAQPPPQQGQTYTDAGGATVEILN